MPNNFKFRGDFYVSKAGNDANAGTSPDAPLLTVQAALDKIAGSTRTIVVGSGVYNERLTKTFSVASSTTYILADGYCVLEGGPGLDSSLNGANSGLTQTVYITGFELRNYNNITFSCALTNTFLVTFQNCIIKNCNIFQNCSSANNNNVQITYSRCVIINTKGLNQPPNNNTSGTVLGQNVFTYFDSSILINSSFTGIKIANSSNPLVVQTGCVDTMKNTYVDANSSFSIHATVIPSTNILFTSQNPNLYTNNNIQGKIICDWTGLVSGNNSTGVALDLAQHRLDYPTFNVNSFSADPKFNNPRLLDFTLQTGSPNVSASSDFVSNIGGTEYAVSYTASSAAFTTNATSQSLEYRGIYYGISGSATTGSITSGPMFLQWPRTKPLTSVNWMGALEFNKTISASFAGNTNVPAYTTFTSASGEAGANPDRLKIRMRFSTQQTQPSTDAEWDNNGYWTPGTYQLFEINQKPTIDYKGTGNGDPTYAGSSAIGDLVPSWIQTEIILRNDYNR